jgi:hypothetical protein
VQLVQVQPPDFERPYAGDRGVRYRSTRVALGDFLITILPYGGANPLFRAMRRMAGGGASLGCTRGSCRRRTYWSRVSVATS